MQWEENDVIQNSNWIKKRKLHNVDFFSDVFSKRIYSNRYHFEDLANEIFYEIFEYLDLYDIYKGFFNLNQRFQNLIINSNFLNQINISTMSKSKFEYYHKNILLPNKHRIRLIRLSNPFMNELIFSSAYTILRFIHLETLIFDHIEMKDFIKLINHLAHLHELYSLIISLADHIQSLSVLFSSIFQLKKLKYCKIEYTIKDDQNQKSISFDLTRHVFSPIQYLIINGDFPFNSLNNLLSCLPELHHISIQSLVNSNDNIKTGDLSYYIHLRYLKYVSFKLNSIDFNKFENIIKQFFDYVEILHLTMNSDEKYLNAKLWQQLIISYMPYLRIFDMKYQGSIGNKYDIIKQFSSSFWIEKKWFFTHEHDWKSTMDRGVFYSSIPYRRKDYMYYWASDEQLYSHNQEENFNSVNHLFICSKIKDHCLKCFPNVNQLIFTLFFDDWNDSIVRNLNCMISLEQLTKIVLEPYRIPLEDIIRLLCFTSNLHTLQFHTFGLHHNNLDVVRRNYAFEYASKINKIKSLILHGRCSLNELEFIVNLFPQLKCLETGMNRTEIQQIIRFLLSKTHNKTQHLFYLCIAYTPKVCIKEINVMMKSENLLKNYSIKYINSNLYLWW
ncbi:unnamed protein product [Rotaria sordida]|uniref:F-box domain-containing protein n=1 Tax=Rotaria sordida TaxID=392033 RepID=A0A814F3N5_9BILA|nr:unnamed protein product [Rotaria sordida]